MRHKSLHKASQLTCHINYMESTGECLFSFIGHCITGLFNAINQ